MRHGSDGATSGGYEQMLRLQTPEGFTESESVAQAGQQLGTID